MARTQIAWSAFEYHYHPKTNDWYWAVGIIAVSVAATSVIFGNILFAFFILISAFALCIVAARKPRLLSCEINDRGIVTDASLYPFTTLESFWVEDYAHIRELDNPHHVPKVILKSKKLFMPYIILPIEAVEPDAVRDALLEFLPEEEHMEPLSQKIMERLGF